MEGGLEGAGKTGSRKTSQEEVGIVQVERRRACRGQRGYRGREQVMGI